MNKISIRKIVESLVVNFDEYNFNTSSDFNEFINELEERLEGLNIVYNNYIGYLIAKYTASVFYTKKQGYYLSYNNGGKKLVSWS